MLVFPVEAIPNSCQLYYRLHRKYFEEGELQPNAFCDKGAGMSVDWGKYSTPKETQMRAPHDPFKFSIGILKADKVREIPQVVNHTPSLGNKAHAEVIGAKTEQVQIKLIEICETFGILKEL